jgi:hypothetical protein
MTDDAARRPEEGFRPRPKDRLVQTRVPRDLESTLKREARRRRLTVSHLIRNILEDAFRLVDDVVANVDEIVNDSVDLARRAARAIREEVEPEREEMRRHAEDRGDDEEPEPEAEEPRRAKREEVDPLGHVYAWNRVVLNRAASCARCGRSIPRGEEGFAGLSDHPFRARAWLCASCAGSLGDERSQGGGLGGEQREPQE